MRAIRVLNGLTLHGSQLLVKVDNKTQKVLDDFASFMKTVPAEQQRSDEEQQQKLDEEARQSILEVIAQSAVKETRAFAPSLCARACVSACVRVCVCAERAN